MSISGLRVTLLVSGSIAAYKASELVRELTSRGASVRVGMTQAATQFVTPLTLETLSRGPVISSMFLPQGHGVIDHIELADNADVVVLAPATADVLAKCASGIADDIVTCTILATRAPIVVAPAMNVNMWENQITQQNIERLKERGIKVVGPDKGELACGWIGAGRMVESSQIVAAIESVVTNGPLNGCRVIVTAGPTEEPLDPIRFVSNRSSGKMGFALARVARARGAEVTLISGPTDLEDPAGIRVNRVRTAEEMKDAVFSVVNEKSERAKTIVIMAAAVSDHRPENNAEKKLKADKRSAYQVTMVPNPDILRSLAEIREVDSKDSNFKMQSLKIVGFAAETETGEHLIAAAREKLRVKKCDLIVGNSADEAFGLETNSVVIVDRAGGVLEIPALNKDVVAGKILDQVSALG